MTRKKESKKGRKMPRIKRWFPVSHDINSDPEVWAMRHQIGEKALGIWLEILSIADRNEGEVRGDRDELVRSIAGKCQASPVKVRAVINFGLRCLWLSSHPCLNTINHGKYHKKKEPGKIPVGITTGSLPSEPSEPSEPKKEISAKTPPVDNSKKEEEGTKELTAMVDHIYRKDSTRFSKLVVWVNAQTKKGWKAPQLLKALVAFSLRDAQEPIHDWWPYLTKACQAIRTQELQGEAAAHVVKDPSSMGGILNYLQKGET